jgi:hypothetical protein
MKTKDHHGLPLPSVLVLALVCASFTSNATPAEDASRVLIETATALTLTAGPPAIAQIPQEPISVQRGVPQFFVDDWLIDNRFAIKYKHNAVVHVVHPPRKHEANPVYRGDCGYVNVARHPRTGRTNRGGPVRPARRGLRQQQPATRQTDAGAVRMLAAKHFWSV